MNLAAIDIGGTTIKIATWKDNQLQDKHAIDTPKDLNGFYQALTDEVDKIKNDIKIEGVAISSPGAVHKKTGIIGGSSAIPYIHNFKIVDELEKRFGLPVSIENDANSAALGELASPVAMANRYNKRTGKHLDGKTIFELADKDDPVASDERQTLIHALAVAIYNIQHSFDPEKIVLGGGISNNPELIPLLNKEIDRLRDDLDLVTLKPDIVLCKLKSDANLRGAVADFEQSTK